MTELTVIVSVIAFLVGVIVGASVMRAGLLHIARKYQEHSERREK
jgi:uncharacterized membrane-anchored protein YhcB (DUF1043 family)